MFPPLEAAASADDLVRPMLHGLWFGVTSSPWTAVGGAAALLMILAGGMRGLIHPARRVDPVRRFTAADKAVILGRAGSRCERHGWLGGRCPSTDGLEADHVHPHLHGGQTALANGQALCRAHNRAKSAGVPYRWQLRTLERRRATYFRPGADRAVVRYSARRP